MKPEERFIISFIEEGEEININFSKGETSVHYPKEVFLLENSPRNACGIQSHEEWDYKN